MMKLLMKLMFYIVRFLYLCDSQLWIKHGQNVPSLILAVTAVRTPGTPGVDLVYSDPGHSSCMNTWDPRCGLCSSGLLLCDANISIVFFFSHLDKKGSV